jgi:hypothetical protein
MPNGCCGVAKRRAAERLESAAASALGRYAVDVQRLHFTSICSVKNAGLERLERDPEIRSIRAQPAPYGRVRSALLMLGSAFAFAFVIPRLPQALTSVSFTPMGDDGGRDGDIVAAPGP